MADRIAAEMGEHGLLPFARFMELALYCPLCGYYEQEADSIGRRGDYYTSVSVGGLFGELLACQFAAWLAEPPGRAPDGPLDVVEAGAHDGRLAADILGWLRTWCPDILARLRYWIVEPSARRQAWQRATLAEFTQTIRWVAQLSDLAVHGRETRRGGGGRGVRGVIFANELLDALPVRRLGWDARARNWFEWGVKQEGARFVWARLPEAMADSPTLQSLLAQAGFSFSDALLSVLPDGFTLEVCPAAVAWWRAAAAGLGRGRLLAIDYGLAAGEFLSPHRRHGTLRACHRHQVSQDVLANPGCQDITAQVNFTALQTAGEALGLRTETFSTQAQFLTRIAQQMWREKGGEEDWDGSRVRQFQTLIHPEHLGQSFRVLIQSWAE